MATSKLSSKAAKLDFSNLPGVGSTRTQDSAGSPQLAVNPSLGATQPWGHAQADTPPLHQPKTAPGALMAFANDARSTLMRENEDLRRRADEADQLRSQLDDAVQDLRQWDGAKATRLIDPTQIARSRFANRHEMSFSGPDYEQLKAEILSAGGNVQPIKVRSLGGNESGQPRYEVVFGHRRHQVCLELGLPVLAVVDNLDDRTLFIEMDRENRSRKDLSAWEQGLMYQRALDEGLFPSNRKLAEAVGVDVGNLGRALALARLPEAVVRAFPSPLDLQFRWAKALSDAVAADKEGVLQRARALMERSSRPSAREVFQYLTLESAQGGLYRTTPPPTPVEASIHPTADGGWMVRLPAGVLPAHKAPALLDMVQQFIQALPPSTGD